MSEANVFDFLGSLAIHSHLIFYVVFWHLLYGNRRKEAIQLQTRVALALNQLGTSKYLQMCGDLFGLSEASTFMAVR